jgi:mono/diheme cytochrome c family protein
MGVRVLLSMIVAAAATAPCWAGEGDASRGSAYATAMCASCHSVTADKTASPNTEAPPFRDTKLSSAEALAKFFNTTHPNTSRLLKDAQAEDIFSYIATLKAAGGE